MCSLVTNGITVFEGDFIRYFSHDNSIHSGKVLSIIPATGVLFVNFGGQRKMKILSRQIIKVIESFVDIEDIEKLKAL